MATKLIYGPGRIPKSSEFALGDIVVNVDDSKAFSKSKNNVVFEIGAGGTTTAINAFGVPSVAGQFIGFTTASINTGSFNAVLTASNSSNLVISGGVGISITTGSEANSIILNATGDAIASVLLAETASYIEADNIDGTISIANTNLVAGTGLSLVNNNTVNFNPGGGLEFNGDNVDVSDLFLRNDGDDTTSGIITAAGLIANGNITASGNISASSGNFTGDISSSGDITASGDIFAKRLRLPSGVNTSVAGIIFDEQAGNSGFINDDGTSLQLGYNDDEILTISSSTDVKVLINGDTRIASGHLKTEGNITASSPIPGQGNISASGLLFTSASTPSVHSDSILAVVYDTASGQYFYTGSYGAGSDFSLTGTDTHILFFDGTDNPAGNASFTINKQELSLIVPNITASGNVKIGGDISASGNLFISKSIFLDDGTGLYEDATLEIIDDVLEIKDKGNVRIAMDSNGDDPRTTIQFGTGSVDGTPFKPLLVISGSGDVLIPSGNITASGNISTPLYVSASGFANPMGALNIDAKFSSIDLAANNIRFRTFGPGFDNIGPRMNLTRTELRVGSHSVDIFGGFTGIDKVNVLVTGSINSTDFLRLDPTGSSTVVTAVAGALIYSASNEFYLGFS